MQGGGGKSGLVEVEDQVGNRFLQNPETGDLFNLDGTPVEE
jgi:hypothetical protein